MKKSAVIFTVFILFSCFSLSIAEQQPSYDDLERADGFYAFLDHNNVFYANTEYESDTLWLGGGVTNDVFKFPITTGAYFEVIYIYEPGTDEKTKKYVLTIDNDNTYADENMSELLLGFGASFSSLTEVEAYTVLSFLMQEYATELASGKAAQTEKAPYKYKLYVYANNFNHYFSNSEYTTCTQYTIAASTNGGSIQ